MPIRQSSVINYAIFTIALMVIVQSASAVSVGYMPDSRTSYGFGLNGAKMTKATGDVLAQGHILIPIQEFSPSSLVGIDIAFVGLGKHGSSGVFPSSEVTALYNFVLSGGSVILLGENDLFDPYQNSVANAFGVYYSGEGGYSYTYNSLHPVMQGPYGEVTFYSHDWGGGQIVNLGPYAISLIDDAEGDSVVAMIDNNVLSEGSGHVFFLSDVGGFADYSNKLPENYWNATLWNNIFAYTILPEPTNHPPIANAGDDQTVYAYIDGIVEVTLDGSDSTDIDSDQLSYYWSWMIDDEIYDANGVAPIIELPVGEHVIELVVNDGVEDSEPNSVLVTVIAPVEAKMFFVPRVINRSSRGRFVMALMYLPEGIEKGDIVGGSFALYINGGGSGPVAAAMQRVIGSGNVGCVLVMFDRADVIGALPADDLAVRVDLEANLEDGRYIVGLDTVRIVRPKRRVPRKPTRSSGSRRSGR
ncbi:MAG: hypothetical protein KAR47_14070 [Planctomycetes bacterium]|nr:hypothetical protein [Planctomycetota bacterium]